MGSSLASFVEVFIVVYILLLFAYILTSWIRLPYNPWLNRVQRFLYDVCDPYLRIFRRFLPPLGPLDLSPMVGVIVLLDRPENPRLAPPAPVETENADGPDTRRDPPPEARPAASSATSAPSSTACWSRSPRATGTSGATAPTSPTRSSSSSSTSSATRSSRDCSARRSSPPRARPQQLREQARKEAEGVVAEAHAEARAISRRASAEKERLETELRRIRSLLHSALDSLDEADLDAREPVGESTGEIRRMIS